MTSPDRRTALGVVVVGAAVFVALAAFLVPWNPVPGGDLRPLDAGSVFTAEQISRAEDYSGWARTWSYSSLLVSLAVVLWLAFSQRGRSWFERLPGPWWIQVVVAVTLVEVLRRLITLPFAVLLRREQLEVGLSTQAWSGFVVDLVKGELVSIVATSLGLLALMACARRWRRAWPAVAGGLLGLLVLAGSFVYPLLVEPLFNDFQELPDGPLRAQIMQLADEEGVQVADVLVADASRRTTTLNAYVSGFGGTRRVVVYDNLVDGLPQDQALSVVAHELAHARHQDVVVGTVLGVAGTLLGVGLLSLTLAGLRRRGHPGLSEPAVVPLVLALLALATLVSAPVQNTISRQVETRADVDALRTTGDAEAFIGMQQQLMLRSLADPTPWAPTQLWFGSHPIGLMRMALAERIAGER